MWGVWAVLFFLQIRKGKENTPRSHTCLGSVRTGQPAGAEHTFSLRTFPSPAGNEGGILGDNGACQERSSLGFGGVVTRCSPRT